MRNQYFFTVTITTALIASPAFAYIGPGAGLGAIGTLATLFGAIVLLLAGFVWYPVKRLLRRRVQPERLAKKTE